MHRLDVQLRADFTLRTRGNVVHQSSIKERNLQYANTGAHVVKKDFKTSTLLSTGRYLYIILCFHEDYENRILAIRCCIERCILIIMCVLCVSKL